MTRLKALVKVCYLTGNTLDGLTYFSLFLRVLDPAWGIVDLFILLKRAFPNPVPPITSTGGARLPGADPAAIAAPAGLASAMVRGRSGGRPLRRFDGGPGRCGGRGAGAAVSADD